MAPSKGMRRIVVDAVAYYWRCRDAYTWDGLRRDLLVVTAQPPRRAIRVELTLPDYARPGWWHRGTSITPAHVRRAIEIARTRDGEEIWLGSEDIARLHAAPPAIEDELIAADAALTALPAPDAWDAFVRAWLGIGCGSAPDELLDDWVACRAAPLTDRRLAWDAAALDPLRGFEAYLQRSALAFLVERCTRVAVATTLDFAAIDERLATFYKWPARPWGIPSSHTWWTG